MTQSNENPVVGAPPFLLIQSGLIIVGVSGTCCLVALGVLMVGGWWDQLTLAAITYGICLVGSLITLVLLKQAARHSAQQVGMAALSGTLIRLAVAIAGGAVLVRSAELGLDRVALWMLGWYLLMLVVDVVILMRYFRQIPASV